MNLLGLHLQLLMGPGIPGPAPVAVSEAVESVQVTHRDEGRSGFQMVLELGRSAIDLVDYPLLLDPRVQPFSRVVISVLFGLTPIVLMDGVITNHQFAPGNDPGTSKLTISGEDSSLLMDLEEGAEAFPNLSYFLVVQTVLAKYPDLRIIPKAQQPIPFDIWDVTRGTITKPAGYTDLRYLQALAQRAGFVFYLEPAEVPGFNIGYWGPAKRVGGLQGALCVNMGPNTNVETISFTYNEMAGRKVSFPGANGFEQTVPVSDRIPPMAIRVPQARRTTALMHPDALSATEAQFRAQSEVSRSLENVVSASGTLDALRYGKILKPHGLVGVRGAGHSYDGPYYVSSVTHNIDVRKGEYKQSFSLSRDGLGSMLPAVVP